MGMLGRDGKVNARVIPDRKKEASRAAILEVPAQDHQPS